MANDDLRDLIGRYATGSLTAEEQKRLFEAALDDQDLFDEVAQEDRIKHLLAEPGARDRLIHALQPSRRKGGWIFGVAAAVALTVVVVALVLTRHGQKLEEVAVAKLPAPQVENAAPRAMPVAPSSTAVKPEALVRDTGAGKKVAQNTMEKKEQDRAAPTSAAVQEYRTQENAPAGPAQQSVGGAAGARAKASASLAGTPPFGFHYSVETKGHLVLVPLADGYLSVRTTDGKALFGPRRSVAGIVVDVDLPDGIPSVLVAFSANPSPVRIAPETRSEASGTVQGVADLAVQIEIKTQK